MTRPSSPALLLLLAAGGLPLTAHAAGGDFTVTNLSASAPYTYDHHTGGGAFDDATKGKDKDIVESLEGGDFACGDHVTYLVALGVKASPVDANQTVQFDLRMLADSTGQSGAAHVDVTNVQVNYGTVQAGDGVGGIDAGIRDDGGSTATLLNKFYVYNNNGAPAPGPFTAGASLVARVQVDDLEANEQVIVRVDGVLGCQAYTNPTGNLQATLTNVNVVKPYPDTVNAGAQTIPFQKVGEIMGTGEPAVWLSKTVTTEGGSCPGTDLLDAEVGDTVKFCYEVRNPGTADLQSVSLVDDNATPGDPSDDFTVALGSTQIAASGVLYGSALVDVDDAGSFTNIAVATGSSGGSQATSYSDSDTATVVATRSVNPLASLSLQVYASPDADCSDDDQVDVLAVAEGGTAWFCYAVTNDGEADVGDITIYGDQAVDGSLSLAPGQTGWLLSSGVVAIDDFSETAYAEGWAGSQEVTSNLDDASVIVSSSDLTLTVTASLDTVCGNEDDAELQTVLPGTEVYFCYTATNAGETWLSDVTIWDDLASVSDTADLAPGESYTFVSDTAFAWSDEEHVALATATDSFGQDVESNPDDASVDVVHPALSVVRTVSTGDSCTDDESVQVLAGQPVTWCTTVTNDGDTTLTGVVLDDGGESILIGDLAPGASFTWTSTAAYAEDHTGTATATATDLATGTAVSAEPDDAFVDVVHPALSISVTVSDDGSCPGVEVVNVLEDDDLVWCYAVTNTGDVAIDDIAVTDDTFGLAGNLGSLQVGESATLMVDDVSDLDLLLSGEASGIDAATGSVVLSNLDAAAVNVVHPGINVDVTVSVDGSCPGEDAASVVAGDEVVYCYTVSNWGDTAIFDAVLESDVYGIIGTIDALYPDGSVTFASAPTTVDGDDTESVIVLASDEYGFEVSDEDAAVVDALYADLTVELSAPTQVVLTSTDEIAYTVVVANQGDAAALDVVYTQTLPAGLTITEVPESCELVDRTLTCELGDLEPGESLSFELSGTTTDSLGTLATQAFVSTTTPESDPSNNTDQAATYVAPGATRTIGFYSTHPAFVQKCLDHEQGSIDLGFVRLQNERYDDEIDATVGGDKDKDVETGLELAMGILNANVSRTQDKKARSTLDKARMQAGRQVLAAICNQELLGGATSVDWTAATTILAGSDVNAILALSTTADIFNNSGDAIDLGVNPGAANTRFPWDDPTDAND